MDAAKRPLEIVDRHRFDPLVRRQLEPENLRVEAELRIERAAYVVRAPEAVLLAFEG